MIVLQVGLIGQGRMGKEIARRLAGHVELTIYDRDASLMEFMQKELGVDIAKSIEELAPLGTVILAVPDSEIINCIKDFNFLKIPLVVINIATNVAQQVLDEAAEQQVKCISVKLIGHADEMNLGSDPFIVINEYPRELVPLAEEIFSVVGPVIIGKADVVTQINATATKQALEAAVQIEDGLRSLGIGDPDMIKSAIGQVSAGVLKAYAKDDLGPFAREIIRSVRKKRER